VAAGTVETGAEAATATEAADATDTKSNLQQTATEKSLQSFFF
jgi:hypothetical protein